MKNLSIILALLFWFGIVKAQETTEKPLKFIEVTGSSEMEIEPDEIRLEIGIEEYWKEEFEKNSDFKDYKTKVPISEVENNLFSDLMNIGITKEKVIVKDVGNYWRYRGKDFLIKKQYEIKFTDLSKATQIINSINTKGIDFIRIAELKNKNITEYRKQVKIEALKAAKTKAQYLLESLEKKLGDIISIVEIDDENTHSYWFPQNITSNSVLSGNNDTGTDNYKKIKLRYEIKAKFEIK
jgi:uncharacterized protein